MCVVGAAREELHVLVLVVGNLLDYLRPDLRGGIVRVIVRNPLLNERKANGLQHAVAEAGCSYPNLS